MKKASLILAALLFLCSTTACSTTPETSSTDPTSIPGTEITSETVPPAEASVQLVNHMTENERSRTSVHDLTLLDTPDHTVSIELWTVEDYRQEILEPDRSNYTDEEYESMLHELEELKENDEPIIYAVLIDGYLYSGLRPNINYDGGEITYTSEDDSEEILHFDNLDAYLVFLKEDLERIEEEYELWDNYAENRYQEIEMVFDAVVNDTYEVLEKGTVDFTDDAIFGDPFRDYRTEWEFDREAVTAIKDSIREISIYDEELDAEFLVQVTLPPDFDENKTYPAFVMTDGVWRFGNHAELRQMMEDGEAQDVILVSVNHIEVTDPALRGYYLVQKRNEMLDFLTDNLMPYLGELYNIDYTQTTLYGHSDGGVFSHNAVFHSDLYENQPFHYYIIGSPAFWGLYIYPEKEPDVYLSDYGYFDRNDTLDKELFICAGSQEDPDYEDSYNGHDTTLEGVDHLMERLEAHGVTTAVCRLYESHHYQYIPEMFQDFLREYYG